MQKAEKAIREADYIVILLSLPDRGREVGLLVPTHRLCPLCPGGSASVQETAGIRRRLQYPHHHPFPLRAHGRILPGHNAHPRQYRAQLSPVPAGRQIHRTGITWSYREKWLNSQKLAKGLIAKGGNIHFFQWEAGSVLPETGRAMEHMASFDYGYKIDAVRDWLFIH